MIPLFLPKTFFSKIDKAISNFYWNNKIPRIRKSLLQCSKAEEGLALPNFMFYYWSANIVKLSTWIDVFRKGTGPLWSTMELNSNLSASPVTIVFSALPMPGKASFKNPVVKNSLNIWSQCRQNFGLKQSLTCFPITSNPFLCQP